MLGFDFFNFCLAASIPSFWDMLVYKEQTFKETTPWTQNVNWTSYVRSIYVLCPGDK